MRARLVVVTIAIGCGRPNHPPATQETPVAIAPAPADSATTATAPSPSAAPATTGPASSATAPAVPLSSNVGTQGWKKLEAKRGFSIEYPDTIFQAAPTPKGVALTSALVVNEPHGVEKSEKTAHRFSARFELRDEPVVAAVKRVMPGTFDAIFPKGDAASFAPSPDFAFATHVAGRDAYVVLTGAHGYDRRYYFVVVDPQRTLTVEFDVITDYLAPAMPKAAKRSEAEQIAIADAVVLSLEL